MINIINKIEKIPSIKFSLSFLIVTILFGILFINLINLQVVNGNENLFLSSTIKTSEVTIRATRGLIYDREGNWLVVNKPSFKLIIDLTQLPPEKEKEVVSLLAKIIEVNYEDVSKDFYNKAYDKSNNRVKVSQITLLNDVDRDKILSIHSQIDKLPGVYIEVSTTREYTKSDLYAHIIGYVREVTAEELTNRTFSVGDMIGAVGLEQYYDEYLRGINGKRIIETDKNETTIRELFPIEAKSGKNIRITMNSDIQEHLTEFLKQGIERNNADGGAAIILDVDNGEIISLVSLPSYDPNKIIEGLSMSEYQDLYNDPSLPLYNRAVSMAQPPGSTFKTVVASAALEEKAIEPSTVFDSQGCMEIGAGYLFCEVGKAKLGKLDFYNGIARSSNIYFCNTMLKLGIDKLNEYTDDFGLGQKTGIDLYGEQAGVVSSKEVKKSLQGEEWYLGDSCNTAIGQGLMRVTPIQMVGWVAAIANGGIYYKPHLAKSIVDEDGKDIEIFEKQVVHTLPISSNNLKIVREGMHLVVNDPWGSAFPLRGLESDPAAKTGSAEAYRNVNGKYETQGHSWIAGFFPYKAPKYAFVVYLEFGGWGFKSAEVMRDFLKWYENEYSTQ